MADEIIILYRYHHEFDLVLERLRLIRLFEPGIKIFGIYGGNKEKFDYATIFLSELLENNYLIPSEDGRWKWLHADFTYKFWYENVGQYINFKFACILEWDLIILDKLSNVFPKLNENTIYFTGLIPLKEIEKNWYWANATNKPKLDEFYNKVSKHSNKPIVKYACLGPGLCAPRAFFEGLINLEIFEADISDEIKIPIWSQLIGLNVRNNNFYNNWFSYFEMRYFNANVLNISTRTIEKQMRKANGKRVFHPYRENIQASELFKLYNLSPSNNRSYYSQPLKTKSIKNNFIYKIHCKLIELKNRPFWNKILFL